MLNHYHKHYHRNYYLSCLVFCAPNVLPYNGLGMNKQEGKMSQRPLTMLLVAVVENFAKSLKIIQGHRKRHHTYTYWCSAA